jgi:hypothetical protein
MVPLGPTSLKPFFQAELLDLSDENKRQQDIKQWLILGVLTVLFVSTGCTATLRNEQLENVAKDWALVIRASQVIPVYPLTEDLQPGDVLLVSMPIEEQVAIYREKGFLPLDQHLVRLYPEDFKEFYNSRYGITDTNIPPAHWQKNTAGGDHNWKIAPCAAFPSYQFSVRSGSGLNLAIPIQGVPFALGLMNSGLASGTVTIAETHTFGLDNFRLEKLVRDWAKEKRRLLRNYEPQDPHYQFLRVVSRVYVTGRVSVTINNDETRAAQAAAGVDRPLKLMGVVGGDTDKNYAEAMNRINQLAAEQLPGAKVTVATATSRSVTLSEEFERPLVIGYVGFDLPILKGGRLGVPISTLAQLTERRTIPASRSSSVVYRLAALSHMYNALRTIQGDEADRIREELDELDYLLPDRYPFSLYEFASPDKIRKDSVVVAGAQIDGEGFQAILDFLGYAQATVETVEIHQRKKTAPAPQLEAELKSARTALKEIGDRLTLEPVVMEAIDFVFFDN